MDKQADKAALRARAAKGEIAAQKQLGALLARSEGTLTQGIQWLTNAATAGDADAMYLLGRIYVKRKKEPSQALAWYERAAQAGHTDAMIDTAAFYLFGYGVKQDMQGALKWYHAAADAHSPVAYHNLGVLCLQDPALYCSALRFFQKAVTCEYAESAYMLGVMYITGLAVQKDPQAALRHLTLSDTWGKHYACRPIGDLYFQGVFDNGKQNHRQALAWYERGKQQDVLSCIEGLGDCYFFGFGVAEDHRVAYENYQLAADKGSADAAYMLGHMYLKGSYVKKDYREALRWMQIAESRGNQKATQFVQALSDVLSEGTAAPQSAASAGSVGVKLRGSYSVSAEAEIAARNARQAQRRRRDAGIFAAAGAMSGGGSYADYEMGAVISADGEVSYVDADMGTIFGADGSVSSYDADTGLTYNWSTGAMLSYNDMLGATMDLSTGEVTYHQNGYTWF